MIPKIIHQTWKSRVLPEKFKIWSDSWISKNPDYEYRFYNDKDCYRFMYFNYPYFLDLYESLKPIERSDVFRYLVLHKYGGIYADMDTTCFRNLDELINNEKRMVIGIEYNGTERGITWVQYLQWFIAGPPGHPVLLEMVKEIERRNRWKWVYSWIKSENSLTYWLTGPELFTEVIKANKMSESEADGFKIMPKGILGCYDTRLLSNKSYLTHHFEGSWKANWVSDKRTG